MILFREDPDSYEAFARVINLARELHCVDFVLPFVFHAVISHSDFLTIIHTLPLSPDDRMVAVSGWANAVKAQHVDTIHWLVQPEHEAAGLFQECDKSRRCSVVRTLLSQQLLHPIPQILGLSQWEDFFDGSSANLVCKKCFAASQRSHNEGRKRYWQKLPTFFGLPDWTDLLKG